LSAYGNAQAGLWATDDGDIGLSIKTSNGMNWASRRKLIYTSIIIAFLAVVAGVPLYIQLNKAPTCFDNKQNGEELGVDCGGACDAFCPFQIQAPIVHWARSFKVAHGVYDVAASLENPNGEAGIREIIYKIKLYDQDNIFITEKLGKTFLDVNEELLIFEGALRTGERIPKRAFIEFEPDPEWERVVLTEDRKPRISIKNQQFSELDTRPRLRAILSNDTPLSLYGVNVAVALYDINDNVIAVSATYLEAIAKHSEEAVIFTWQEPFSAQPVRIDIIPRVNPFLIKDQ